MTKQFSFPKEKIKVLFLENIHSDSFDLFSSEGFQVENKKEALSEDELISIISDIHIYQSHYKFQ